MDDPLSVSLVESIGNLDAPTQELFGRHRPLRQPHRERFALEILHDEVVDLALAPDVVEGADVGCESCEIVFASRSKRWRTSG